MARGRGEVAEVDGDAPDDHQDDGQAHAENVKVLECLQCRSRVRELARGRGEWTGVRSQALRGSLVTL